ncbi:unnamed protein product [Rotaria sordida]|uniref:BTB domain-containing protein n=1 Tax=Rotaria sordida TaxID=392033 RepID=A0A813MRA0_9BILA|nr:unnamed protein product [Rotaria sordida]
MEKLRLLYEKYGGNGYYGEPVTQYEHALQAAFFAEQYAPNDNELIVAAFLHDIGHLLGEKQEDLMGNLGVLRHEHIGAEYLRKKVGLSERICYLVENHVNAKRYLTHIDKDYYNRLSDASKQTLVYQGGPMTNDEAEKFRSHPQFEYSLRMRTFDEAAKDIHFNKYEGKANQYWNLVEKCINILHSLTSVMSGETPSSTTSNNNIVDLLSTLNPVAAAAAIAAVSTTTISTPSTSTIRNDDINIDSSDFVPANRLLTQRQAIHNAKQLESLREQQQQQQLQNMEIDDQQAFEVSFIKHSNAFHTLYEFYQDQILCDVEIVCDNQTFLCHKVVLAATVPYFRSMFTLGMLEADKRRIEIQDINRNSLKTIIEFAYTAKAIITIDNVQHLLFASTVLQTEDLAEACSSFLRQHLSLTNCTEIRQYAELLNRKSLIDLADEYIRDHFLDIIQIDDFYKISYKHLKELIASPDLGILDEKDVYDAVIKWVKHDPRERAAHLADLLHEVKLPLINTEYLLTVIAQEELIRTNLTCRDLLDEAKVYIFKKANLLTTKSPMGPKIIPRKTAAGVLLCVGGRGATGDPFKSVECYDLRHDRWFYIAEMTTRRRHVGVCAVNGRVYAIGGHDGNVHLNSAEVFDPQTNRWEPLAPMNTWRRGIAVGCLGGPLYAVGGLDDSTCFDTVERYDIEHNTWSTVASMSTARGGVAVAALKGYLYACGGNDGSSSLNSCERYCPSYDKWTPIASMNKRRAGASVTVLNNRLYILGGFDDNSPLDSVECFDPDTNIWTMVPNMTSCRGGVGSATLGGRIYSVGGHDGSTYLKTVEAYDAEHQQWGSVASINICRAGAGVSQCDISISQLCEVKNPTNPSSCV